MFNTYDTLPPELETHRNKVEMVPSEILRAFSCECYALTQDHESSSQLTCHSLDTAKHFRPEISEDILDLCDAATKRRHDTNR